MNSLLSRIVADVPHCAGQPCIRDTQITVATVIEALEGGSSADEVVSQFPALTVEDVRAAVAYASELHCQ